MITYDKMYQCAAMKKYTGKSLILECKCNYNKQHYNIQHAQAELATLIKIVLCQCKEFYIYEYTVSKIQKTVYTRLVKNICNFPKTCTWSFKTLL